MKKDIAKLTTDFLNKGDTYIDSLKDGGAFVYSGVYREFKDFCKKEGLKKREIPEMKDFFEELGKSGYNLYIMAPREHDGLENSLFVCSEEGIDKWYKHVKPTLCTFDTAHDVLEEQRKTWQATYEKIFGDGYEPDTENELENVVSKCEIVADEHNDGLDKTERTDDLSL